MCKYEAPYSVSKNLPMLAFSFSTSKPFYKMEKFGSNQILSFVDKRQRILGLVLSTI